MSPRNLLSQKWPHKQQQSREKDEETLQAKDLRVPDGILG